MLGYNNNNNNDHNNDNQKLFLYHYKKILYLSLSLSLFPAKIFNTAKKFFIKKSLKSCHFKIFQI